MMKRLIVALLLMWAVLIGSLVYATAANAQTSGPIHLTTQEKHAKSWTPKIEAKLRQGLRVPAEKAKPLTFDADCFVRELEQAYPSPRLLTAANTKHPKRLEQEVKGMTLDCLS